MSYVPEDDEIEAESDEEDSCDVGNLQSGGDPQVEEGIQQIVHERQIFKNRWPRAIGIAQIVTGLISIILGLCEIFLIPALESPTDFNYPRLDQSNSYGAGVWAGFVLTVTGSTAVRASISKRATTVYRYILFTVFSILVHVAAVILIVVGYSSETTTKEAYRINSALYGVHIFMTISVIIGLVMTLAAFITYYEDVFFGDLQLLNKFLRCILCCCMNDSSAGDRGGRVPYNSLV